MKLGKHKKKPKNFKSLEKMQNSLRIFVVKVSSYQHIYLENSVPQYVCKQTVFRDLRGTLFEEWI